MKPQTDLCKYYKVCRCYEPESFTCIYPEAKRDMYCGAYHCLERNGDKSRHHRPIKDSWLIKLLRQFRRVE